MTLQTYMAINTNEDIFNETREIWISNKYLHFSSEDE